jgi:transcription initiation factor IIE alpha subunit
MFNILKKKVKYTKLSKANITELTNEEVDRIVATGLSDSNIDYIKEYYGSKVNETRSILYKLHEKGKIL